MLEWLFFSFSLQSAQLILYTLKFWVLKVLIIFICFNFLSVKHCFVRLRPGDIICSHREANWHTRGGKFYHGVGSVIYHLFLWCHVTKGKETDGLRNFFTSFLIAIPFTKQFILSAGIPSEKLSLGVWGFQTLCQCFVITRLKKRREMK